MHLKLLAALNAPLVRRRVTGRTRLDSRAFENRDAWYEGNARSL